MTIMNIEQKANMKNIAHHIRLERDALQKTTQNYFKFIGVGATASVLAFGIAVFGALYNTTANLGALGAVAGALVSISAASVYYAFDALKQSSAQEKRIKGLEGNRSQLVGETHAFGERQEGMKEAIEQQKADELKKIEQNQYQRQEINNIADRMKDMRSGSTLSIENMEMIAARVRIKP